MLKLDHPDVFSRRIFQPDRRGRLRRRCRACVEWLEDRTLLSAPAADFLAGIAIPIALGSPTTGTLAAGDTIFYQINTTSEGRLVAQVHADGGPMRLTLLNGQDQVLMQSDGQSPINRDDLITVDVPAGPEYLEVENLGGASTYTLATSLAPSSTPFQPIPIAALKFPAAIVSGDFNGDGRTDLATANEGSNDVSVLLGNGNGTFQHQVTYAVGSYPVGLVAGDFNGDGRTDLATANRGDDDVSVLLGNGDGTFQPQVTYAVDSSPYALVTGDFNGDDRTDLAVANVNSNDVSVLLGNGDGTFQPQTTYAVGSAPAALVTGDFNGDGWRDLAVANATSDNVSVLLGNGDGTFQPQVTYAVGTTPIALVTGDFVGDGQIDLAVANQGDNDVSVLLGYGDGTFPFEVRYAVGSQPTALVTGDLNGDGQTDLIVANGGDNDVSVLLGYGDGIFQAPFTYAVQSMPAALVTGDFNGDGQTDLAVANQADRSVSVLLGNGDGSFQPQAAYAVGSKPSALVTGDFNGDGWTDLAVANYADNDVSVFLGNGDGTFQPQLRYAVGADPSALVTGDFNGDGWTDLAVTNGGSNDVSVLLGNGDGTFQSQVVYAVGSRPAALVTGDFNGDGRPDLAVANLGSPEVSVLLGNGDGTFQNQVRYAVGSGPAALVTGDFNGDGRTDLAVANYDSNDVSVLLGDDHGTFQTQLRYAVGSQPTALATGDFNSDGRTDLAVANSGSNYVSVLLGKGDGTFQNQMKYAVGFGPDGLVAGDFNGDGRTDLAVANLLDSDVSVLLGKGDGTFQNQGTYAVGAAPGMLVAGDFNGDGRIDLAVADLGTNDLSVLLGNGDGTFQTQVTNAVGSYPLALVTADFNGDGRPDLAIANSRDDDVSVLLGNGDGTFRPQVTYAVGFGPVALVAGDFNGDRRTDLAVANAGSNTLSVLVGNGDGTFQNQVAYAVGSKPSALVAGDFNGDGRIDLAVANSHDDDVSVLVGHGDGTFPSQVTYAVGFAPIALVAGDFNGDRRIDLAVVNSGSNDVSVLLGHGDGTFRNQVSYAVGSVPAALVTGDFNGDGRTDLAVANNNSEDVSVLLGNGDGTFRNQVRYPAGTAPLALVTGDFNGDGRPDLAVANTDYASDYVSVLLGNGDGTFQSPVAYAVGSSPLSLVTSDFNGDGRPDLATANSTDQDVSVLLGLNKTFAAPGAFVTTLQSTPVVADLTGDGVDDVLVVNADGSILWRKGRGQEPGTYDPPIAINPDHPSRDIVAVDTNQGPVLASVDATDDAISLYAWRDGSFARIGSLVTGLLPAQIVTADLNGDGSNDLVVRNAGKGTLSVYFNNDSVSGPTSGPRIPFQPPVTLSVGPGVSDVTMADLSGDGRTDILVTNKLTGEVGVLRNLGNDNFDSVVSYRASRGLYAVTMTSSSDSATLTTREATAGVASGALTTGGTSDLVAIDPGTNTFSLLSGLGAGRFANPVTFPTADPARAIRMADLEGNGVPDAIVLSASGVTVYRSDGKGGLLPDPKTFPAGSDPIGMTVADVNHDGKPDLLISNTYGDLLVLQGNGDGTFQTGHGADQNVALAVLPNGSPTPEFIYADQGLDRVVVQGQTQPVADRSSGLLDPGAVQLADLNGDGIPDLIVANSGSNDVLVYPGIGNGQFGPELNGGRGFFTGTNPVGITAVDIHDDGSNDHHLDLVIADKGSNDVSILFYQPAPNGGFTFTAGPRLQVGSGPTSTVVQDVNGDGIPDLMVSDSGSNDVRLLPGVGNGFFNDTAPQVKMLSLPAGSSNPVQVMVGRFLPNQQGPEIVTVNRDTNNVTVISDFTSLTPVFGTFSTGGLDPVEAFGVEFPGQALESLVVANSGDGLFTLLGGAEGLEEEASLSDRELPEPTAVVPASVSGNEVSFYAATAGMEAAFTLAFILPGFTPTVGPAPGSSSAAAATPAQLVPLSETSLALVGTLLVTALNTTTSAPLTVLTTSTTTTVPGSNPAETQAEVNTSFLSVSPSQGQSTFTQLRTEGSCGGEAEEVKPDAEEGPGAPPWSQFVLGVDEVYDLIRGEDPDARLPDRDDAPARTEKAPQEDLGDPFSLLERATPGRQLDRVVDEQALNLGRHFPFPSDDSLPAELPGGPVPVGMSVVVSTLIIVRANRPGLPGAGARSEDLVQSGRGRRIEGDRNRPWRGGDSDE
jgi:hypothetical protein